MNRTILYVNVSITGRVISLSCGFKWLKLEEPLQKALRFIGTYDVVSYTVHISWSTDIASLLSLNSTVSGFVNIVTNSLLLAILLEECHAVDWYVMELWLREHAWNSPKLHIKLQFVPDREHNLSPSKRQMNSVQDNRSFTIDMISNTQI
jgi:hypothetical protein